MSRVADILVRNWPLKMAAIFLATILYSGLVLGQNVRTWTGTLPVETLRPPIGATLLSDLDPVTLVRYRAPLDIGVVSPASFSATADLSRVEATPGGPPQEVPVNLIALDSRIQVVDFQPQSVQVQLDPVATKTMPVTVDVGAVPDGLNLSPYQTDPSTVTVSGGSSRVDQVSAVVARVSIDASALNIDRVFDLVPVDSSGNQVPNIELDPERARVRIAVARELANRTLPLVPQIVGQLAAGYRVASVTVEPLVVTVSGEESIVTQLKTATTEPIDVSGRTDDLEATIRAALPAGVSVSGDDTVRVKIVIEQEIGSRTFFAPVTLLGQRPGYTYSVDVTQIQVVATGPVATLDQMDPTSVVVTIDVSDLSPGTHVVDWSVNGAPDGVEYAFQADFRTVTVTAPPTPIPTVSVPSAPAVTP
ncbi:MAG: CdaR family protein [Candidatus Limnocylindrales bacterium]